MNLIDLEDIENELKELESIKPYESRENIHSKVIAYLLKNNFELLKKMLNLQGLQILKI